MHQRQWQNLLHQGNAHFHNQEWSYAQLRYVEAYELLTCEFNQSPDNCELMMAWICASHNLSFLHETLGDADNALRFLLAPHEYLKQLIELPDTAEEMQVMFVRGMSLTINAIRLYAQKYPICDDCKALYPSLKAIVRTEQKQLH